MNERDVIQFQFDVIDSLTKYLHPIYSLDAYFFNRYGFRIPTGYDDNPDRNWDKMIVPGFFESLDDETKKYNEWIFSEIFTILNDDLEYCFDEDFINIIGEDFLKKTIDYWKAVTGWVV